MLPFSGGTTLAVSEAVEQVQAAQRQLGVEGVTLLGGEPFAHSASAARLAAAVRELSLSVMVFSGYTLEELQAMPEPAVGELLAQTDILVDGPYLRDAPDAQRRWIGSTNQRIHFLSDRYRASDPCWRRPNTLEIRLQEGVLTVNGFPARSAVEFWRRPPKTNLPQT